MKKNHTVLTLFGTTLLLMLLVNCQKSQPSATNAPATELAPASFVPGPPSSEHNTAAEQAAANKAGNRLIDPATLRSASCSGFLSGAWGVNGFHAYVKDTINVTTATTGHTIRLNLQSYDVPNRFTVYNAATGAFVVTSNWMGFASYAGPWGMSINTPTSGQLNFTKTTNLYLLLVETSVNGTSDAWDVSVSCL
jgi:hypothetical protein